MYLYLVKHDDTVVKYIFQSICQWHPLFKAFCTSQLLAYYPNHPIAQENQHSALLRGILSSTSKLERQWNSSFASSMQQRLQSNGNNPKREKISFWQYFVTSITKTPKWVAIWNIACSYCCQTLLCFLTDTMCIRQFGKK